MASSQAFAQSSMATGVMDINLNPDYYRALNPDMVIGSSSVLDVTMVHFRFLKRCIILNTFVCFELSKVVSTL